MRAGRAAVTGVCLEPGIGWEERRIRERRGDPRRTAAHSGESPHCTVCLSCGGRAGPGRPPPVTGLSAAAAVVQPGRLHAPPLPDTAGIHVSPVSGVSVVPAAGRVMSPAQIVDWQFRGGLSCRPARPPLLGCRPGWTRREEPAVGAGRQVSALCMYGHCPPQCRAVAWYAVESCLLPCSSLSSVREDIAPRHAAPTSIHTPHTASHQHSMHNACPGIVTLGDLLFR